MKSTYFLSPLASPSCPSIFPVCWFDLPNVIPINGCAGFLRNWNWLMLKIENYDLRAFWHFGLGLSLIFYFIYYNTSGIRLGCCKYNTRANFSFLMMLELMSHESIVSLEHVEGSRDSISEFGFPMNFYRPYVSCS